MFGLEILYTLIAFAVIGGFLFAVRRASDRQLRGGDLNRRSLPQGEEEPAEAEAGATAEQAAGEQAKPKPKPKPKAKPKPKRSGRRRDTGKASPGAGAGAPAEKVNRKRKPEPEPDDEAEAEIEEAAAEEEPEAPETEAADAADEAAEDQRLRDGLARTRGGFVARLGQLFAKKRIDTDILADLEEVLFTADIGPKTAHKLFDAIKEELSKAELRDTDAIWAKLREQSESILAIDADPIDYGRAHPFVLLIIGVNGVGKTTTIGKIAAQLAREGKRVLLAAGDTFRAAAVEQLEIWGDRARAPVVKGKSGGDPSSVIFDAIKRAQSEDFDVVIADTAGRLHTKVDLMEELMKVGRVVDKAMPGAPHETLLVLDATTGQNAIQQAQLFQQAMNITGIALTKLDGTAKGGVILGICDELKVPVRYVGIGEQVDDLRGFDPGAFVAALYESDSAKSAA